MGIQRQHLHVTGVVQGVGFRPFVYGLAHELALDGWVYNSSDGVDIEIQGFPEQLDRFRSALCLSAPPLAHIDAITTEPASLQSERGFLIRRSASRPGASLISPDVATCRDCLHELLDPTDRRYRYAFTNCTNCGPRFTIIEGLPYDRPLTTMSEFPMCPDCQAEYENPLDRRFRAQPNACPACGPRVWMTALGEDQDYGSVLKNAEDPFKAATALLRLGGTVAVKGLGGFHLACDATNNEAVRWLRRRKGRHAKPFAVMMSDLDVVRHYCTLCAEEEGLLGSPAAPVVLLWRKPGTDLALSVTPRNRAVGVVLPYTPLHHILMGEMGRPLVMTSGNHADEPIAQNNENAREELADIADAFLFHNRRVHERCDDSVWMVAAMPGGEHRSMPIRRSRGYAPFPIKCAFTAARPILGAGAQMKNVFAVFKQDQAFLSQHIGELDNLETLGFYRQAIEHLQQILEAPPDVLAHDMHPGYLSTRYVKERVARQPGAELIAVQHHHAHIASCLADNQVDGPVIGVALDGTGYGTDGRIWGGEFMIADWSSFERAGHLEYLPLPGGEVAIQRPYRTAIAYLLAAFGEVPDLPFLADVSTEEQRIVVQQTEGALNSPLTSSCGRLFDAVAALVGMRGVVTYEAQAAVELEMAALPGLDEGPGLAEQWLDRPYPFGVDQADGRYLVRVTPVIEAVVREVRDRRPLTGISLRFHATLARVVQEMCRRLRADHALSTVALSGDCFQNRLLLRLVAAALDNDGFQVLTHRRVPPNDGGVALGQVAVAAHCPGMSG